MPADAVHRDDEALSLLALGALTPEEARAVEEHLAGCVECRRLGRRLGELAALADSVEPVAPPGGVREALLARLDDVEGAAREAALVDLAAGRPTGVRPGRKAEVGERRTPDRTPPRRLAARRPARLLLPFAAERDEALRRATVLSRDLTAARAALALTPAPEAVLLAGLPAAPEALGRVFVDRAASRAVVVARGLPELPEDLSYQLWRIVDGQPRPAGLLDASEGAVIVEGVGAGPRRGVGGDGRAARRRGGAERRDGAAVELAPPYDFRCSARNTRVFSHASSAASRT